MPPHHELLSALRRTGCPVCHLLDGVERSFFFWFCSETYAQLEVLHELTGSLGFCPGHAVFALQDGADRSPFAASHGFVVGRLRQQWQSERRHAWEANLVARGGEPSPCPACHSRAAQSGRSSFFLARLAQDPRFADSYAAPGMLCAPHLRQIAPQLHDPTLERFVRLHRAALLSAREGLVRAPDNPSDAARALWLAVGRDPGMGGLPAFDPVSAAAPEGDLASRLEHDIAAADACPICLAVGRAWQVWTTWLDAAARRDAAIEDVLPCCADHVWASLHVAGRDLRTRIVRRALDVALTPLSHAQQRLDATAPKIDLHHLVRSLGPILRGRRVRLRIARGMLARDFGCPVCQYLASTRDRALQLLFALLEARPHRAAYERGYGLCLRHYGRALALGPLAGAREALFEVEAARLARLDWDLAEHGRKAAWQIRPEPKGSEQAAPVSAIRRFSGNLDEALAAGPVDRRQQQP